MLRLPFAYAMCMCNCAFVFVCVCLCDHQAARNNLTTFIFDITHCSIGIKDMYASLDLLRLSYAPLDLLRLPCTCGCMFVCECLCVFLNACPYLVAKVKGGQLVPMQRERTNGGNCQYFHFPIEMGLAV